MDDVVKRYAARERPLLARLARRMRDCDLRIIAASDYGSGIERHLAELIKLRETLVTEHLGTWYPMEVIELCRWHVPKCDSEAKRQEIRAFCCTVILHRYAEDLYGDDAMWDTIHRWLDSLVALGAPYTEEAVSLVNALVVSPNYTEDEHRETLDRAALVSALQTGDDAAVLALCERIRALPYVQ